MSEVEHPFLSVLDTPGLTDLISEFVLEKVEKKVLLDSNTMSRNFGSNSPRIKYKAIEAKVSLEWARLPAKRNNDGETKPCGIAVSGSPPIVSVGEMQIYTPSFLYPSFLVPFPLLCHPCCFQHVMNCFLH